MTTLRRAGALVASAALAVSGVALTASPASAAVQDERPATIAAEWLSDELVDGLLPTPFDPPFDKDYGLSADTAFALAAVGGHDQTVTDIANAIAPNVAAWYDVFGTVYTGSLAKAALLAETAGLDATAYGGKNLVTELEANIVAAGPSLGRAQNVGEIDFETGLPTDSLNVISQAFAAAALVEVGSSKAEDAFMFLLQQQCPAGYFRLYMNPDKNSAAQSCDEGRATGDSDPHVDATATALRLIAPYVDEASAIGRAVGRAEAWLVGAQRADGSFISGTDLPVSNSNSTGLAGWILGDLGNNSAAERAAAWIRGNQADEVTGCANGLSAETGAVGYDRAAVTAGLGTGGITAAARGQWQRATAQALPALRWLTQVDAAPVLSGPTGYVRAGSSASYTVTDAVPGEKLCLTGSGTPLRASADTDGKATIKATVPAGTANRTLTVTNRTGESDQTVVKALGAKTFPVALSKLRPVQGTLVKVRATGLAPGEKVRLTFRGVTLRTAVANANGVYVAEFNVRRTLGKGTVSVFGEFAGRRGSATLTVVR